MTVICAYTDGTETWIGSDRMISSSNEKWIGPHKWHEAHGWAIGVAGAQRAVNMLERVKAEIFAEADSPFAIADRLVQRFAEYGIHSCGTSHDNHTECFGQSLLLARKGEIWNFGFDLGFFQAPPNTLIAKGSGADYAMGAGYAAIALHSQMKAPFNASAAHQMMITAIGGAEKFDPYCAGCWVKKL